MLADRKTSLDDIQATDSIVLCDVGDFNQETERIIGTLILVRDQIKSSARPSGVIRL